MPARFTATTNLFEKGIDHTKPQARVTIIQGWQDALSRTDRLGAKGVRTPLPIAAQGVGEEIA